MFTLLLLTAGFDLAYDAPAACPSRDAFIAAVEAQTGKRAFTGTGSVLRVRIIKARTRYVALIELETRRRELRSSDCDELVQSAATVAAVAIDPQGEMPRETEPPASIPTATAAPETPLAPAPVLATESAARPRTRGPAFRMASGVVGALAVGPQPSLGFALELGMGWRYVSLNFEANAYLPSATPGATGVSSTLIYGAVSTCGHASWFVGCLRGGVGGLRGEGIGISSPRQEVTVYAFVGARAGVEIPLYKVFYLRPVLDVLFPLNHTTLQLDERPIWSTPVAGAALALQALLRFE